MSNVIIVTGKPTSNVDIYLVDKNLNEVSSEKVGEILVAGLNLASSYVGSQQKSQKFIKNPHSSKEGKI